jgi:tetratricopeptide (TPR) repeat protein
VTASAILIASALLMFGGSPGPQDSLQAAKDLYASAAYEDALAILSRLQRADPPARADALEQVQQYRAFCLIALSRLEEAQQAIESVVTANPMYVPSAVDVPPRIQEAFARTRKQLLPEIARQQYILAKRALDRKDRDAAVSGFEGVVRLIDGAGPEAADALDELRFLAAGFLDLSKAMGVPPREPAPAQADPVAPVRSLEPPLEVTPPIVIRQVLPRWIPTDAASRQATFVGAIRVSITATGFVENAQMLRPAHPSYDPLLLEAAKSWEYQPARRGGVAVPSDRVVEVQLKPPQ